MTHHFVKVIVSLYLSLAVNVIAFADMVVVINAELSANSITPELATKIFLKKTTTLADGTKVTPIDQAIGNDIRSTFYTKVVNKTVSQLNAYWSRLVFTGKGRPPKSVDDDEDVLESVGEDRGLIGYMSSNLVDDTVKVILTVR